MGGGQARDDVVRQPCLDPGDRHDLVVRQAADNCLAPLERSDRSETFDGALDRVVREPGAGRVSADAVEVDPRGDVSQAAGLDPAIGRLEQDREVGLADEARAVEERRQWVELRGKLLAPEEEQGHVDRAGLLGSDRPHELERHRDAAFHVARAEPVHRAGIDPPGQVVLCRDGVVVPAEHDQRRPRAALAREQEGFVAGELELKRRRHELEQVRTDRLFVAALRGDVDELERPLGQPALEVVHGRRA